MNKSIGSVIRINRISQNMSIRALAGVIGIEYSQLSKIERGLESSSDFIMDSIFSSLDLDYEKVKEFLILNQQYFNEIYRDILFRQEKEEIYSKIIQYNEFITKSELHTVENSFINLIYHLMWYENDKKVNELFQILDKMADYLEIQFKQLYYQYRGLYYLKIGDLENTLSYLNESEKYRYCDHTMAYGLYIKGDALTKYGDIFESYNCLNQAKRLFESYNNYIRSIQCTAKIADVYLLSEKYQKAIEQYIEVLKIYRTLKLPVFDKMIICENILYTCILSEQYSLFYDMHQQFDPIIITLLNNRPKYLLYRIIASYELGQFDECKTNIEIFQTVNQDEIDADLAKYYDYKLLNYPAKVILVMLLETFDKVKDTKNKRTLKAVVKLIVKEYERENDYKKMYEYILKLSHGYSF